MTGGQGPTAVTCRHPLPGGTGGARAHAPFLSRKGHCLARLSSRREGLLGGTSPGPANSY